MLGHERGAASNERGTGIGERGARILNFFDKSKPKAWESLQKYNKFFCKLF